MTMKIDILETGSSKGNSLLIDDKIMIDMGLPYKYIGKKLEQAELILITHRHGDHINIPALRKLDKLKPWKLKNVLYCNRDVAEKIENSHNSKFDFVVPQDHIISDHDSFQFESEDDIYDIDTFPCVHDVENQGFVITKNNEEHLLFATDTSTIEFAPMHIKYDYIMLEGNYDEDILNDTIQFGSDDQVYRASQNLRHLSIQDYEQFVKNQGTDNCISIQLHESETFGRQSGVKSIGREQI